MPIFIAGPRRSAVWAQHRAEDISRPTRTRTVGPHNPGGVTISAPVVKPHAVAPVCTGPRCRCTTRSAYAYARPEGATHSRMSSSWDVGGSDEVFVGSESGMKTRLL